MNRPYKQKIRFSKNGFKKIGYIIYSFGTTFSYEEKVEVYLQRYPGNDLFSQKGKLSTIVGAAAFNYLVRNGKEWCHCARITGISLGTI
jgi:hypothetical protein